VGLLFVQEGVIHTLTLHYMITQAGKWAGAKVCGNHGIPTV
jgi:hypothetical protein